MDEILSRWYGLGGDWINLGMPHYVKMDLNPYIGFKIKDTLSGNSMVMMELNLVNGRSVDEASDTYNGTALDGDMNHETKLIKELVDPWALK